MITSIRPMPQKQNIHAALVHTNRNTPAADAEILIIAARTNDSSQIRMLLDDGAFPDAQDKDGWTALHWAIKYRNVAVATALVEAGASSEVEARDGWTPMALAVKTGSPTIIEIAMKGLDRYRLTQ